MKKSILIVAGTLIVIMAVLLTGCVSPIIEKDSGPVVTRNYDFTDFNVIQIGYAFRLEVTRADTYSIQIDASESIIDDIKVTKTGNKLEIGLDRLVFQFARSPRAKITMPELRGLDMSGAARGDVSGFRSSQDFDLALSGASQLEMDMETGAFECEISGASEATGYLKATSADIELSGASQIEVTGSGGNLRLDASGASQADLDHFTVNDADIELSGASNADLYVNGRLDADLSGLSEVNYEGNATLGRVTTSGGSDIERR
jgi:hypothetical protein